MKTLNHTPGPWAKKRTAVYDAVYGADGELIAFVGIRDNAEAIANANLLVAAPDMLAALKSIVPSLEARLTAKPKDVEAWDILNIAKAAIQKAERVQ